MIEEYRIGNMKKKKNKSYVKNRKKYKKTTVTLFEIQSGGKYGSRICIWP